MTAVFGIYVYTNGSVLIYASDALPGAEELSLIREWQSLPSVDLVYSGPEDFRSTLNKSLMECGILAGGGTPLFVRIDEDSSNVAIWIRYEESEWDNYNSPAEISKASESLKSGLKKTIGCYKLPDKGFLIKFSPEGISATITELRKPSTYVFSPKDVYEVYLDGVATNMKRGFHEVDGNLFFVGKEGMSIETARLFQGVEMVFPVGREVAIYSSGKLIFGDKEYRADMRPVGFWNGNVVLPNRVVGKNNRELKSTAIDVYEKYILEASGYIEAVDGSWRKKISCTPLEWYWSGGKLYILDICGYYREVNLEREEVIYSKKAIGSYGFDFLDGKVVFVNNKNFCVVSNEKVYGDCIRLHNGYALKIEKNGIAVLGRKLFLDARDFMFVNGSLILVGDNKVWLVRFKK